MSNEHDRTGFNVGFESGPDLYNFILEQATIGYDVDREIGKLNIFSQKKLDKPLIVIANTIKGKGVSFMENKVVWHYRSANEEELSKGPKELE